MTKILLVEDDPMISEIYQRKFKSSGFEVDSAMSGSEVLAKAKDNEYDLILLDLVLPEMNGMDILEKMRNEPESYDPNLKVAIFSNLNDQENQDKAVKLGAIGFIEKSLYNPSELVEEVKRIMHEQDEREKNKGRREKSAFGHTENKASEKHILFVEDEDVFMEMFGDKLRDEGYTVDIVSNGEEGVRRAVNGNYDLLITDVLIPGIKGDEVVRQVRENEKTKNLPIIVLSASATDEQILRVEKLGIQSFCLKTRTTPTALLQQVQSLLEK